MAFSALWFQCGEKCSLVPKTFVETIASLLALRRSSVRASVLTQHFNFLDGLSYTLNDRLLLELGRLDSLK